MEGVAIEKIVKKLELKKLTEEMDLTGHRIVLSDVNRPALQLSGYFEHFEEKRVQIIGNVEYTYLQQLEHDKKIDIYNQFLKYEIPCVIFCRDLEPDEDDLEEISAEAIEQIQGMAASLQEEIMKAQADMQSAMMKGDMAEYMRLAQELQQKMMQQALGGQQ